MKCQTVRSYRPNIFEQLDRGLNRIVRDAMTGEAPAFRPLPLTVTDESQRYVVECDLPGVPTDDVSVQVEEGILEIKTERRRTEAAEGVNVLVDERSYGQFSRRLQLAADADATGIDAEFGNGVLRITIPKSAAAVPNKIAIRTAAH